MRVRSVIVVKSPVVTVDGGRRLRQLVTSAATFGKW